MPREEMETISTEDVDGRDLLCAFVMTPPDDFPDSLMESVEKYWDQTVLPAAVDSMRRFIERLEMAHGRHRDSDTLLD